MNYNLARRSLMVCDRQQNLWTFSRFSFAKGKKGSIQKERRDKEKEQVATEFEGMEIDDIKKNFVEELEVRNSTIRGEERGGAYLKNHSLKQQIMCAE